MFKAIKDNKIIAISDTDSEFPCLVCYAIANEPDHTTADYVQVNGEFVLTSSAEAIEQTAAEVRSERDRRIDAIRWRIERYQTQEAAGIETTETAEQYQALLMYIQALRNVPEQDGFPDNVVWPTLDAEIEAVNNMATVEASTD